MTLHSKKRELVTLGSAIKRMVTVDFVVVKMVMGCDFGENGYRGDSH